jgi:hypothetical protein
MSLFFFFFFHTVYKSKDYGKVFWDKLIPYKEILLFWLWHKLILILHSLAVCDI